MIYKLNKNNYKKLEDHPEEINIETYVKLGKYSYLREGLPEDHPENLYNWFSKTYPDLNPNYYGIYKPVKNNELLL